MARSYTRNYFDDPLIEHENPRDPTPKAEPTTVEVNHLTIVDAYGRPLRRQVGFRGAVDVSRIRG